jgi:hypothetical protein
MLAGVRAQPSGLDAVARAIAGGSELIVELGERIEAPDVSPVTLRTGPRRRRAGSPPPGHVSRQLIAPAGSSA